MSYSISIADEEFDHTYNTHALFKEMLPGDTEREAGIKGLYGMTGAEAAEYIEAGLERLSEMLCEKDEDAIRAEFDAPNKWGTLFTSTLMLSRLMAACLRHPFQKIEIC
tara:strand:- start:19 stop:345 length:327 start_codon:yes stop_codon:yes gene_type:complete